MASAATIEAYKAKLAAEAGIRLKLEDMLEKASAKAGKASASLEKKMNDLKKRLAAADKAHFALLAFLVAARDSLSQEAMVQRATSLDGGLGTASLETNTATWPA